MKRIGLLGCGMVARYGHIPAIQETPGLSLHALYDPNPTALRETCEQFGIERGFTDEEEFIRSGVEALSITSPAPCHRNNVLLAARHHLPVICEKPLAMDRREAEEMIAAMESAGVSFLAGFCYRFSPTALRIRELLHSGAIGRLATMRLIYNWNCHGKYAVDSSGNRVIQKRREDRMFEGGPLFDCGTHQIDLAHFWTDSPVVRQTGHGAWADEYEVPDHLWLHMDHANGVHSMVEISFSYHHTSLHKHATYLYELIGTEGVIHYDREAKVCRMENSRGTEQIPFYSEKSFPGMYAAWEVALRTGESALLTSAADGMRVVEIAREATEEAIARRGNRAVL